MVGGKRRVSMGSGIRNLENEKYIVGPKNEIMSSPIVVRKRSG